MVPVDDDTVPVAAMVEGIVGCKWALSLLDHLEQGVRRPGELQRRVDGLSTKVMNERLRKMVRFGILARTEFPEFCCPMKETYIHTASFVGIILICLLL